MPEGRSRRVGAALLLLTAVAACGTAPASPASPSASSPTQPAPSNPPLAVDNWTTMPLTLVVNGHSLEVIRPGTENPVKASLPPLPWDVEVQSRGGRVLARLEATASDPQNATRVDLACGRIDIFVMSPVLGPPAIGSLPPCD